MIRQAGYERRVVRWSAVVMVLFALGCDGFDRADLQSAWDAESGISPAGIIGGSPTDGAVKWRGVVGLSTRRSTCSGTLIDPEIVLTAGHCVLLNDDYGYSDLTSSPESLRIVVGADMGYNGTVVARGWEIVPHPTWTGDITAGVTDLALVKLDRPVENVATFPLVDFPMPQSGQSAYLVGYGDSGYGESGVQREGATTIWTVTPAELETGGNANTCPGDSGGPVLIKQDGQWAVAGVNSYGAGTVCSTEQGMWAVNVLSACHWLNDTMMDLVGRDLGLEHCTSCNAAKASDWGQGCGPGFPDCPKGTECMKPVGFSVDDGGYCAAPCCDLGEGDAGYCSDIADGEEMCGLRDDYGTNHCVVQCRTDSDCPEDTTCKNRPFESEKICIAKGKTETPDPDDDSEPGDDGDPALDDDSDDGSRDREEDRADEEAGEDPDENADGGDESGDLDVNPDAPDGDTDSGSSLESQGGSSSSGWGCSAMGPVGAGTWRGIFRLLF